MARERTAAGEGALARLALRFTGWAERWFPDAFIFVAIAVLVVAVAALVNGASAPEVAKSFGDGFWTLIPFTMQMAFVTIGGYVVATSAPVQRLIDWLARRPRSARGAIGMIALATMVSSLLSWGLSLIFGGLLARACARRRDLRMDYRAAGAAAYLGLGATWAMGLSSSAAQLQANPASLPPALLPITGVIPFSQTIFLWQSMLIAGILIVLSTVIAMASAPGRDAAVTAEDMGIDPAREDDALPPRTQPGEWLEHAPLVTVLIGLLAAGWLVQEFARQDWMVAISNLNTYNFLFLMAGLVLHWRPKRFLIALARAVPATAGILIQYPFYAAIAAMLTGAKNGGGGGRRRPDRARLCRAEHARLLSADHGRLFGDPGIFRAVGRRQVAAGGALCDAGGQRTARPSRLGGADLQCGRGPAQSHQPLLDVAFARHPGVEGTGYRGVQLPAADCPSAGCSVPSLGPVLHPAVPAARPAVTGADDPGVTLV